MVVLGALAGSHRQLKIERMVDSFNRFYQMILIFSYQELL